MGHFETAAPRLLRVAWLDAFLEKLIEPAETETGWRFLGIIRWLVLLDIAMLSAVVYDAPYFQVSRVIVKGTEIAEVAEYLSIDRLRGRNALTVDIDAIAREIERAPAVKRVVVERQFPDAIAIAVQERQPVAVWQTREGRFLVDDEGIVVRAGDDPNLPTVHAVGGTPPKPGTRVDAGAAVLAARLVPALAAGTEWRPVQFELAAPGGITVTTDQGWKVTFGQADDLAYKLELLQGVLQVAKERKDTIDVVDLRSDTRPAYRAVQPAAVDAPAAAGTPVASPTARR